MLMWVGQIGMVFAAEVWLISAGWKWWNNR